MPDWSVAQPLTWLRVGFAVFALSLGVALLLYQWRDWRQARRAGVPLAVQTLGEGLVIHEALRVVKVTCLLLAALAVLGADQTAAVGGGWPEVWAWVDRSSALQIAVLVLFAGTSLFDLHMRRRVLEQLQPPRTEA